MHYWFKNSFAWTYRDLIEAVQQMILINSFAVLTCWDLLKQFNQLYFILIYFIHLTVLMCWDLIGAVQPIIVYWKSIEELFHSDIENTFTITYWSYSSRNNYSCRNNKWTVKPSKAPNFDHLIQVNMRSMLPNHLKNL